MAVTYGFFDSRNGDRKYNADQMSEYFRGIVSGGVFQHLDGGLQVTAGTGLSVNVAAGRAIVQNRWIQNSASLPLSISAASETYGRKDAVVLRLDSSARTVSITVKTGTPAASPAAPSMTRSGGVYEMALAYVNVAAGATSVTVTDKRSDSAVCGWAAVAQETSGEVDQMLNDMKTGFDGVVYSSPAAMVQGCDEKIANMVDNYGIRIDSGWLLDYGAIQADSNYYHTGFMPCMPGDTLTLYNALTDNQYAAAILFFTINGNVIGAYGKNVGSSASGWDIVVPDGAISCRVNIKKNAILKITNAFSQDKDFFRYMLSIPPMMSYISYGFESDSGVWTFGGANNAFAFFYILLDKEEKLEFSYALTDNPYISYLIFADENGQLLSSGKRSNTGNVTDTIPKTDFPANAKYARITVRANKLQKFQINQNRMNARPMYVHYSDIQALRVEPKTVEAEIVIPSTITAVVGDTLQIYYDSIIRATGDYSVEIIGTKGHAYPRYFEYTPVAGDVGTSNLTINVKVKGALSSSFDTTISTKTVTLSTIAVPSSPGSEKHILMIGDSTIVPGTYVKEVCKRICVTDNLSNVKFTGRLHKTESGIDVGYEGFSGWKWSSYASSASKSIRFYVSGVNSLNFEAVYKDANNCTYNISEINVTEGSGNIRCLYVMGSATTTPPSSGTLTRVSGSGDETITYSSIEVEDYSPFYVNGEIDFEPYIDEYCSGTVDYVVFALGTNEIINSNAEFSTLKSAILSNMAALIEKLHTQYPNAKVLICTLQKGSLNGGFGYNFGTAYNANSDFYNNKVYQLNQAYLEFIASHSSYVFPVNLSGEFDSKYDFPNIEKPVNVRNSAFTELIDTNFGHPSTNGYYQMADAIYRSIYKNM